MHLKIDEIENKIKDAIHSSNKDGKPLVLEEEFARFDLNGDGYISTKEFRKTLKEAFDLTFSDSQYKALLKHAEKYSETHIKKMLDLMRHTTFAKAHRQVMMDTN